MSVLSFLDRERSVAPPGFDRWRVPPAAIAIHLCIGQAYAFSVFNLPLSRLIGGAESVPGDWKLSTIGWVFSVAIVFLGLSAAVFGRWLERVGPRRAMFTSAACFAGGLLVSALGVATHQFWLLVAGYGVLGGIGLGIGYISPVSTLMKWFPDRPGMATGMAIMGFGGGAMLASPLSVGLMSFFGTATHAGVWQTFIALGVLYFAFMMLGVFAVRVPAAGWQPAGWTPPASTPLVTTGNVPVDAAMRTPQFWLLWVVLCVNVSAGIGVLGQASPMIQETFGARISASAAAGFVALLSLANMAGRFMWSSLSDHLGRRRTYAIFFAAGALLYAAIPALGRSQNVVLFVVAFAAILTMYGGGFATIPAYLRDMFGTMHVGAIHGRLLTAWSLAGILGPVLVNYIREYRIAQGTPPGEAYGTTMYIMVGLLLVGLAANLLVRPVDRRHVLAADDAAGEPAATPLTPAPATGVGTVAPWPAGAVLAHDGATLAAQSVTLGPAALARARLVALWLAVAVPAVWAVSQVVAKSLALFR